MAEVSAYVGSIIPLLTDFEKEHISERQALPEKYLGLSDDEMDRRIAAARATLGNVFLLELGQQRNDRGHLFLVRLKAGPHVEIVKHFAISGREKAQTPQPGYCPVGFGLPQL